MADYVPQNLANAFVESAGRHFRTLEQSYHIERSLEVATFGPDGIQRVQPEEIGDRFFMIKLLLIGPNFSAVISYGEREHDLGCLIRGKDFREAYALWEWLEIFGKHELMEDSGGWVLTEDRVEAVLEQLEHALEQLVPFVVKADPAIEQQLEHQRQERMRLSQLQLAEEEHIRLASKATEAFHRKDYAAVIEALSAVQVELTASEQAKLAYARKQLRH